MSSSEEEVEIIPVPRHRIRFSDMPQEMVDQAIRRKSLNDSHTTVFFV